MEPVFLEAETGGLPELKRVIVVAGDQVKMEPTLKESIAAIFGAEAPPIEVVVIPPAPPEPEEPVAADIANLIEEAQLHYNQAQQYLQAGDLAGWLPAVTVKTTAGCLPIFSPKGKGWMVPAR